LDLPGSMLQNANSKKLRDPQIFGSTIQFSESDNTPHRRGVSFYFTGLTPVKLLFSGVPETARDG
jgi:hypothetical protein